MKLLCLAVLFVSSIMARDPLAQRIGHTDETKMMKLSGSGTHLGANQILLMPLLDPDLFYTNVVMFHRGVILPKSGIGHHFQYGLEDCFVIFDGEAQFTVDGRTTRLEGPVAVPAPLGHSHALYNPTDKPVQWLNIVVSVVKGVAGNITNLGDDRVGAPLDPKATFLNAPLRRDMLRKVDSMNGGRGTVQYRRALVSEMFKTNWAYLDHLLLPSGTSVGPHRHMEVEEIYYVMNGEGSVTIGSETAAIRKGDAVPVVLRDVHSLENNGTGDLEFLVVGVSLEKGRIDSTDVRPGAARRGP
jgi:mannose-6-phosphate isomerase-like protein (cupin superfamily)